MTATYTPEDQHTIDCCDSWCKAKQLPTYSGLTARVAELSDLLSQYVRNHPAFRAMPVGAPGSLKRLEQEAEIALEDMARAALAKSEG